VLPLGEQHGLMIEVIKTGSILESSFGETKNVIYSSPLNQHTPSEFRGFLMSWQYFKQTYLVKFWSPVPAVIAAGILSTYYFGITGTFWAVTGEFTRWGGQLLQLAGVHTEEWGYFKLIHLDGTPLTRIDGMMIIGMFGGCFAAALWANNVKLRLPKAESALCRRLSAA
jgi:hypothetical protein